MSKFGYSGKLFREFCAFAWQNKVYWIVPLVLLLGLVTALIVVGNTATPFVYTLF